MLRPAAWYIKSEEAAPIFVANPKMPVSARNRRLVKEMLLAYGSGISATARLIKSVAAVMGRLRFVCKEINYVIVTKIVDAFACCISVVVRHAQAARISIPAARSSLVTSPKFAAQASSHDPRQWAIIKLIMYNPAIEEILVWKK
jgi:hypothetical protein